MLSKKLKIGCLRWLVLWGIAVIIVSSIVLVGVLTENLSPHLLYIELGVILQYLILNIYYYRNFRYYANMIFCTNIESDNQESNIDMCVETYPELFCSNTIIKNDSIRSLVESVIAFTRATTNIDVYNTPRAQYSTVLDDCIENYIKQYPETPDIIMNYYINCMEEKYGIKPIYGVELAECMTTTASIVDRIHSCILAKALEFNKKKLAHLENLYRKCQDEFNSIKRGESK